MSAKYESIAARFRSSDITKAAIIDDAFETPDVTNGQISEFWSKVEDSGDMLAELRKYGNDIASENDISESILDSLWEQRDAKGPLKDVLSTTLFCHAFQKLVDLRLLRDCLYSVGITDVREFGPKDVKLTTDISLVFLDFSLDGHAPSISESDLEDPVKLATLTVPRLSCEMAKSIWEQYGQNKPFLVLISDHIEAWPLKGNFLEESHVLGGLFGFISKKEFANSDAVLVRLASWGIGCPSCQTLQRFVTETVSAIKTVADDFQRTVSALDVHDYAHIQQLALKQEGHPLGEYLVWLFESLLANQFRSHSGLQQAQRDVDRLVFSNCLPCDNSTVGTTLTQAYWKAQTLPVDEVAAHPWDATNLRSLFGLGDLFLNDDCTLAHVLVNAPCDLRFVPLEGSKRRWKEELALVFVTGSVEPYRHSHRSEGVEVTTEFVWHKNRCLRIVWDVTKPITVINRDSATYLLSNSLKRICRLRPLYALAIKTEFVNALTRLGTPVTPPMMQLRDVEIWMKGGKDPIKHLDVIKNGCMVFIESAKLKFLLTTPVVHAIVSCVTELYKLKVITLEKEISNLDKGNPLYEKIREGKQHAIVDLRDKTPDIIAWLKLAEVPLVFPEPGEHPDVGPELAFIWNEIDIGQRINCVKPICIRVLPVINACVP